MQMHHQAIAGSSLQHFNPSLTSGALPAELDGVPADLIIIPETSNNIFTEALMAPLNPSTETLHENSLDDNNMIDFDALIWYDDGLIPVETELDFRTDSLKAGPADGDYGLL